MGGSRMSEKERPRQTPEPKREQDLDDLIYAHSDVPTVSDR